MMDGWNDSEHQRCFHSYYLMIVRCIHIRSLMRSPFLCSFLETSLCFTTGYQTISSSRFPESLPFRTYLSPTILASCKYFNLPYFQSTWFPISVFLPTQISSFLQSLSPYLILLRYFAAPIISNLNLDYHISGITLCPKHVTILGWQFKFNETSPQLERFFQSLTRFWDNTVVLWW